MPHKAFKESGDTFNRTVYIYIFLTLFSFHFTDRKANFET